MPQVEDCTIPGACVGGIGRDQLCREGHEGPFCAVCDISDPSRKYFQRASGECVLCSPGVGPLMPAFMFLGVVALLLLVLRCLKQFEKKEKRLSAQEKAERRDRFYKTKETLGDVKAVGRQGFQPSSNLQAVAM